MEMIVATGFFWLSKWVCMLRIRWWFRFFQCWHEWSDRLRYKALHVLNNIWCPQVLPHYMKLPSRQIFVLRKHVADRHQSGHTHSWWTQSSLFRWSGWCRRIGRGCPGKVLHKRQPLPLSFRLLPCRLWIEKTSHRNRFAPVLFPQKWLH